MLILFIWSRLLFYFAFREYSEVTVPVKGAFAIGARMDLMVSSYVVLIPFLLLSIRYFIPGKSNILNYISLVVFLVLTVISILIICADIPYYKYFKSRITTSVLLWMDDISQSLKFVFSEKKFYPFLLLFFFFSGATVFLFIRLFKKYILQENRTRSSIMHTILFVLSGLLLWYGSWGAQMYRPIGIRNAFFTNESFINNLTLNPVLTYFDSFTDFKFKILDTDTALSIAQRELRVGKQNYHSPVARMETHPKSSTSKNIVLILMEGMSAERMGIFGNKKNLTPFLDSLARKSIFFSRFYSCGIHTCNGIYGSLYGMPSILSRHPMSNVLSADQQFYGLPQVLKDNGYTTLFFCSHHEEFDNMGYFLPRNGIDHLYSLKDYPKEFHENVWGVNDEFLLNFSLAKIDSVAAAGKPFLSVLLTISTHPPQQMPRKTDFVPRNENVFDRVYEYADFALRDFFKKCETRPWYENTIFALTGDHGINSTTIYDAPLSLNHVPFILFAPGSKLPPLQLDKPAMQTDIFPTLMDAAGMSFVNNTLGINLLTQTRPFAYFTQDKKLCVINSGFYLVVDKSGNEHLYRLAGETSNNFISIKKNLVSDMRDYAYSMIQTSHYMIERKLVGKPEAP